MNVNIAVGSGKEKTIQQSQLRKVSTVGVRSARSQSDTHLHLLINPKETF